MNYKEQILQYQGYIFDLDGTIYLSNRLLGQADQVIYKLNQLEKKILFLTNKPIESRADYAHKLNRLGIPASMEQIINSSLVTAQYISHIKPEATVYVIGELPLIRELENSGLQITENPLQAEFLIVSFDRNFHYNKLNDAMIALKNGARYFATNPDQTCPIDGGEIPDCAGMIGAIHGVTNIYPELICGKPSPVTLRVALEKLKLPAKECLMIGDRLETDIKMGNEQNMDTALVMTGITSKDILKQSSIKPTYVLQSLADFIK